jgi:transcriptional regulator with XRE-family HTH domain
MSKEEKALKIKIMLKEKGITQRALAQKLGMSPQSLSNRLNGDTPLDANLIVALKPILGDVVMDLMEDTQQEKLTRPRIPYDVAAGPNEVLDGVTLAQCEQLPVIPVFPNYTFTMRVTGESMQPYINPGDEVACLKIDEPTFLQWGRVHVLFTSQGVIVKKIFDAGKGIKCVSINPDYPEFIIPKKEIYSYNLVVGLLRL